MWNAQCVVGGRRDDERSCSRSWIGVYLRHNAEFSTDTDTRTPVRCNQPPSDAIGREPIPDSRTPPITAPIRSLAPVRHPVQAGGYREGTVGSRHDGAGECLRDVQRARERKA